MTAEEQAEIDRIVDGADDTLIDLDADVGRISADERAALDREIAEAERELEQLETDSKSIFGPEAQHYEDEDLELSVADAEAIAAAHNPAPRPTTPDPISARHLLPPPVADNTKLGCCLYVEGAPTTEQLRAAEELIVGLPLVFPAAGPQPYYGAHQINSDADIPPAAIMNLAFANGRELDQPGLLQRFEDGQIGYSPGTQFTETWTKSAFRNKLRSFRYKCLQQTAQP